MFICFRQCEALKVFYWSSYSSDRGSTYSESPKASRSSSRSSPTSPLASSRVRSSSYNHEVVLDRGALVDDVVDQGLRTVGCQGGD